MKTFFVRETMIVLDELNGVAYTEGYMTENGELVDRADLLQASFDDALAEAGYQTVDRLSWCEMGNEHSWCGCSFSVVKVS